MEDLKKKTLELLLTSQYQQNLVIWPQPERIYKVAHQNHMFSSSEISIIDRPGCKIGEARVSKSKLLYRPADINAIT